MKKQKDFQKYVQAKIDKKNEFKKISELGEQEVMLLAIDVLMGCIFDDSQKSGKKVTEDYGGTIGGQVGELDCESEVYFNFSVGERAKIFNEITSNPKLNDIIKRFKNEPNKIIN